MWQIGSMQVVSKGTSNNVSSKWVMKWTRSINGNKVRVKIPKMQRVKKKTNNIETISKWTMKW